MSEWCVTCQQERDRALCPACGDHDEEGSVQDEDRYTNTVEDAEKFERRRARDAEDQADYPSRQDLRRDAERDEAEDRRG